MISRPNLSRIPLWERHEQRVLNLVGDALSLLSAQSITGDEAEFNRELYFCLLRANRQNRDQNDNWFDYSPVWEARNPPTRATTGNSSEFKIPDFYLGYIDHDEPDPERCSRNFVIECKRLGAPTASGWAFNVHYVEDGIIRFIHPGWRYGKDVSSGAMVGYIESMEPGAILAEVNATAEKRGVPGLGRRSTGGGQIHHLDHSLRREFPVSPFRLTHIWADVVRTVSVTGRQT